MIHFDKVTKIYSDNSTALDGVTFSVEPKEFVSIVGHSGAGKTTLLKMLLAEEMPTSGKVFFGSTNINKVKRSELNLLRRRMGARRMQQAEDQVQGLSEPHLQSP